ncbi:MAG: ferritin-like domain-containing protein [Acidimicrobiia bacterium]|nr:ferritin-like domain-containing protein [Acidimicrobiia bacterium]
MTILETPQNAGSDIEMSVSQAELDVILAAKSGDPNVKEHLVDAQIVNYFSWDYESKRDPLHRLYEKAKRSQWNATTDIDWSIEVDQEKVAADNGATSGAGIVEAFARIAEDKNSPIGHWGVDELIEMGVHMQNWTLSNFLHGEQGALLCTARIVEVVPDMDAKYYASTQVMDEARHVEVFSRYLDEKLGGKFPINPHLEALLDDILVDSRWDMTYLGMQIMVEGLALAAFGFIHAMTTEPLLKQILRYVMSDEARHVAFGVMALKDVYSDLTQAELRERQEFAYEAALRMRNRFLQQEVWEAMNVDPKKMVPLTIDLPERRMFQSVLFSKIVPNCKKLGLLDAGDGWLRQKFTELGVIQFEDWVDTSVEYETLDALDGGNRSQQLA